MDKHYVQEHSFSKKAFDYQGLAFDFLYLK